MPKPLPPNGNLKTYLSISDAAKFLGVTPMTLRRWDQAGKLTARRHPINGYRLYKKQDLQMLLTRIEQQ